MKNTIGRIPTEWYDDYPHLGYDLEGQKIMKSTIKKDELDKFLDKMEKPDDWWLVALSSFSLFSFFSSKQPPPTPFVLIRKTLHDKVTDTDVILTDKELEMIERITGGHFPDANFDPFEDHIDFFTSEKMIHPVSDRPEPKSRFTPSKWEAKKIVKLARAIRQGWIKVKDQVVDKPKFFAIWNKESGLERMNHIPAPKIALPQHNE